MLNKIPYGLINQMVGKISYLKNTQKNLKRKLVMLEKYQKLIFGIKEKY